MRSFQDVLREKITENASDIHAFPLEEAPFLSTPHSLLMDQLMELNIEVTTSFPQGKLPPQANLYLNREKTLKDLREQTRKGREAQHRRERTEQWLQWQAQRHNQGQARPSLYKYYEVFAARGEWDFAPGDSRELKKAFRRLLRVFHPDTNKAPEALEITRQIIEAHEFLKT